MGTARLESEEKQYQEHEREELWAEEERLKRARRVAEQRQRREADATEITDQARKEAEDAEDDYYRSEDHKNVMKMMIVLLLFLQKQNLAYAVYQFGSVLSLPD